MFVLFFLQKKYFFKHKILLNVFLIPYPLFICIPFYLFSISISTSLHLTKSHTPSLQMARCCWSFNMWLKCYTAPNASIEELESSEAINMTRGFVSDLLHLLRTKSHMHGSLEAPLLNAQVINVHRRKKRREWVRQMDLVWETWKKGERL